MFENNTMLYNATANYIGRYTKIIMKTLLYFQLH